MGENPLVIEGARVQVGGMIRIPPKSILLASARAKSRNSKGPFPGSLFRFLKFVPYPTVLGGCWRLFGPYASWWLAGLERAVSSQQIASQASGDPPASTSRKPPRSAAFVSPLTSPPLRRKALIPILGLVQENGLAGPFPR